MGINPLVDCGIFVGGYDFTGESNRILYSLSKAQLPRNAFGDRSVRFGHGLPKATAAIAGYLSAENRAQLTLDWGLLAIPFTFMKPIDGAPVVGDVAEFCEMGMSDLEDGGDYGADTLFIMALQSSGTLGYPPIKGYVLNPGRTAVTIDGGMAAVHAGAVATGKNLYGILHVTSVSASDSVVVKIQSAAEADAVFASPTDRITFTAKSAIGSQIAVRIPGPITDTYWRAYHDVTGSAVSIKYACAMGIK